MEHARVRPTQESLGARGRARAVGRRLRSSTRCSRSHATMPKGVPRTALGVERDQGTHVARCVSIGQLPSSLADARMNASARLTTRRSGWPAAIRLIATKLVSGVASRKPPCGALQGFEHAKHARRRDPAGNPCDRVARRTAVMPRQAERDQGRQRVADDRQAQDCEQAAGAAASSNGSDGITLHAPARSPNRPASAHIVRIGTEKVRSCP